MAVKRVEKGRESKESGESGEGGEGICRKYAGNGGKWENFRNN